MGLQEEVWLEKHSLSKAPEGLPKVYQNGGVPSGSTSLAFPAPQLTQSSGESLAGCCPRGDPTEQSCTLCPLSLVTVPWQCAVKQTPVYGQLILSLSELECVCVWGGAFMTDPGLLTHRKKSRACGPRYKAQAARAIYLGLQERMRPPLPQTHRVAGRIKGSKRERLQTPWEPRSHL